MAALLPELLEEEEEEEEELARYGLREAEPEL